MADRVIICGLRRGGTIVPQTEILQMIGRCGRTASYAVTPSVFLLVEDQDLATAETYISSKPPGVTSQLVNMNNVAYYVLPDICSGKIVDKDGIEKWLNRSFAVHMRGKTDIEEALLVLVNTGMVEYKNGSITPLPQATVSTSYLFPPWVVQRWVEKVGQVLASERIDDAATQAWLLARADKLGYRPETEILEEYTSTCDAYGYDMVTGEELSGLVYYCALTQQRPTSMKYPLSEYRADAPRVLSALRQLDSIHGWNLYKHWQCLLLQITRGVDTETAEVMHNTGILTKSVAKQLADMGYKTMEEISDGLGISRNISEGELVRYVRGLCEE